MDFIKNNIYLVGLALGSAIMLLLPMFKKSAGGVPNVSASEAVTLINRANALVLDVRDDTEFESGHIADATHIPVAHLEARLAELKKYKTKPILVNCQRGARSAKACEILRKAEFTQIHNLHGGLNAWIEAKLPIVKSTDKVVTKPGTKSNAKVTAKKVTKTTANTVVANHAAANDEPASIAIPPAQEAT